MTNEKKIKLFDDIDYFLEKHPTSQFSKLATSVDPEEIKKRLILEKWFLDFPISEKAKFKSRFLTKIPGGISSPFYELAHYCPVKIRIVAVMGL